MPTAQVLIVEDKQPLADMYADWLADTYAVQVAYTGREALEALDHDIDVVLLDRRLPDIPGDEILAEMRDQGIDCSVAMVTAVSPNFDVLSLGFDDYLTKPVSMAELRETVADLVRRAEVDEALRESFAVRSKQSTIVESILQDESVGLAETAEEAPWEEDGPGEREIDMGAVDAHVLPTVVSDLADEYEARLGYRDRFLLKWLHVVFPFFTLTSVAEDRAEACQADKTLASMFVMLLDDIGERHHDRATLAEVAKLPFPHESVDRTGDLDTRYLEVTESVWETFESRLRDAPRFREIEPIIRYDIRQVIHAIRYSVLVNQRPAMANMAEAQALGAHNMMMLTYADIDIAYSPGFEMAELGKLRSLLLELQEMARIGNWITTWERELAEGDVSAGVFVSAIENGILAPEDLRNVEEDPDLRQHVHERIEEAQVEQALLEQWQQRYEQLGAELPELSSIDVAELLAGMEQVMGYHLASRGLK